MGKTSQLQCGLGDWIALSVKNSKIKCCSNDDHKIAVYSLTAEFLLAYGTRGRGDAGQLYNPYILDDDDDGSVLIADRNNHRLQVMSEQWKFNVIQLQPPVSRPDGAVLINNKLYVTSDDNKKTYRYAQRLVQSVVKCWVMYELQVIIYDLQVVMYELQVVMYELQVVVYVL